MVRRVFLLLLGLWAGESWAQALVTHVDRTWLEQGDVFTLKITLSGVSEKASPPELKLAPLNKAFEIISVQQHSQLQMQQGKRQHNYIWALQLVSKQAGEIRIPPLTVDSLQTDPVTLHVRPLPEALKKHPRILFTQQVDTQTPYLQQQVIYTFRLYHQGSLHNGLLSTPVAQGFQLLPLGSEQVFAKLVTGKLYTVVERRYVLFPQQAGKLLLPPLQAEGQLYVQEKLIPVQARTRAVTLNVKPVPKNWPSHQPWLPAYDLKVALVRKPDKEALAVGEAQIWQIQIYGKGVRGEQLPTLMPPKVDGLQIYTEPEQVQTQLTEVGVIGKKQLRWTVIAQKAGEIKVPRQVVFWWNLDQRQLLVEKIEEKEIYTVQAKQQEVLLPLSYEQGVDNVVSIDSKFSNGLLLYSLVTFVVVIMFVWLWRMYVKRKQGHSMLCEKIPLEFYAELQQMALPASADVLKCQLEKALFLREDEKEAREVIQKLCKFVLKQHIKKKSDYKGVNKSGNLNSIYID